MVEEKTHLIIGSEEWIALPDLGLPAIKVRVDSGAKTSALHAFNIQKFWKNNQLHVSFEVHPIQNDRSTFVRTEAEVIDERNIKSSSGQAEKRYVIKSQMQMGQTVKEIEITLTNRDAMGYRMLLGREAMGEEALINPNQSFLHGTCSEAFINKSYGRLKRQQNGLSIGLLASNPDLYSNRRILEAGRERGHEMQFLNIKECYMRLDALNPEIHSRSGKILNDLDAVIPRIKPAVTFYGAALVRLFESLGIYALNRSQAITQSRDKLFSLQLLLKHGLEIPTTSFANSPIDTDDLIDMVGGAPLIIKLLEGTQGTGVVLAETRKAAESVISAFKALKANILVQEFIDEAQGSDIRCFVIGNKVVASMQRQAKKGEFRANVHKGATTHSVKITAEEKKMVLKAAKVVGLAVAGVDFIRSNKGPLLLEVNSSPGLEGIEDVTGKDIAREMILAIEKKLNWVAS